MDIITLIKVLVSGLLDAEEDFLEHLDTFSAFEETVHELTDKMAADFLGLALTNADKLIRESGKRKSSYTIQRRRQRTLISSAGDITFTHTLYRDNKGRTRCLLDELIRLPERERFTPVAEAKVLNEAEAHSYQHAAESIKTNGQTITKTTVMNKVHSIEKEIREMEKSRGVLSESWSIFLKGKKRPETAGESWFRRSILAGFTQERLKMLPCGKR